MSTVHDVPAVIKPFVVLRNILSASIIAWINLAMMFAGFQFLPLPKYMFAVSGIVCLVVFFHMILLVSVFLSEITDSKHKVT